LLGLRTGADSRLVNTPRPVRSNRATLVRSRLIVRPTEAFMDTATVIEALERAPGIVVPLVREIQPAALKQRPAVRKWSAHEHACHLAHVHGLFFDRLDQILASPSPVITPYDPGQSDPDD